MGIISQPATSSVTCLGAGAPTCCISDICSFDAKPLNDACILFLYALSLIGVTKMNVSMMATAAAMYLPRSRCFITIFLSSQSRNSGKAKGSKPKLAGSSMPLLSTSKDNSPFIFIWKVPNSPKRTTLLRVRASRSASISLFIFLPASS